MAKIRVVKTPHGELYQQPESRSHKCKPPGWFINFFHVQEGDTWQCFDCHKWWRYEYHLNANGRQPSWYSCE